MSDAASPPTADPPVIARVEGRVGRLTLNRPRALHALTTPMCALMTDALLAWRKDDAVEAVMLDHAGERGFCAGGDIRMIADSGGSDGRAARAFFAAEYRLNHLLFVYPKPVIAIMDGVVMGGGVGISAPARHRVATERTLFAMPESGIGLFPDVGGGWYLPRLAGEAGMWLALTGARLNAADCRRLGLATACVRGADVEALKAGIVADPGAVDALLATFEADPGPPPFEDVEDVVRRAFAAPSVEAIVEALEAERTEWAAAQLRTLSTKSPQALKVAFRQLREGAAAMSFAEEMTREYRIACRISRTADFREGVRAVIVDKDNAPRWSPATLAGVSDAMLDAVFAPLPAAEEWTALP